MQSPRGPSIASFGLSDMLDAMRHRNIHHSDVVHDGPNYLTWKLTLRWLLDDIRVLEHVDESTPLPMALPISNSSSSSLGDIDGSPPVSQATLDAYAVKLEK